MSVEGLFNRTNVAILFLVLVAGYLLSPMFLPESRTVTDIPRTMSVKVKRIVNGNRFKTESDESVILAGIRAPYPHEPFGQEVSQVLQSIIEDKRVRLRFDTNPKDRKDRWVAYVFCDDRLVNEQLLRDGLAFARLKTDQSRFSEELLAAQREARSAKRGLWKTRNAGKRGDYVGDPKHGSFHLPGCVDVPNIKSGTAIQFNSMGAAFDRGFSPCIHCNP